jgi:hypothetical protein
MTRGTLYDIVGENADTACKKGSFNLTGNAVTEYKRILLDEYVPNDIHMIFPVHFP